MYLPIAASIELTGRSAPGSRRRASRHTARTTWDRVRRVDGVHLCPPGIGVYAAAIAADVQSLWGVPAPAPGWWWTGGSTPPRSPRGPSTAPTTTRRAERRRPARASATIARCPSGSDCPSCGLEVSVDGDLQSAACTYCQQWLHALVCPACAATVVGSTATAQRCPRCHNRLRFGATAYGTFGGAVDPATGSPAIAISPSAGCGRARCRSGRPRGRRALPRAAVPARPVPRAHLAHGRRRAAERGDRRVGPAPRPHPLGDRGLVGAPDPRRDRRRRVGLRVLRLRARAADGDRGQP